MFSSLSGGAGDTGCGGATRSSLVSSGLTAALYVSNNLVATATATSQGRLFCKVDCGKFSAAPRKYVFILLQQRRANLLNIAIEVVVCGFQQMLSEDIPNDTKRFFTRISVFFHFPRRRTLQECWGFACLGLPRKSSPERRSQSPASPSTSACPETDSLSSRLPQVYITDGGHFISLSTSFTSVCSYIIRQSVHILCVCLSTHHSSVCPYKRTDCML